MHEGLSHYQYINQPTSRWWAATKWIMSALAAGGTLFLALVGAGCIINH